MANWSGWAHHKLSFRRVVWPTWEEAEEYEQITGGQLELSAFTDLKVDGELTFEGLDVPNDHDLIRIYYGYEDSEGEKPMEALATLMFSASKPTYEGMTVRGKLDCKSTLAILASREYGAPFTIAAGTQAIQKAIELVESVGLRVNNEEPSSYAVKNCHTFKAGDANYLSIVNWLLDAAGYSSAWVDAYGIVQMTKYEPPNERTPSLVLADDENSILYPEVMREYDFADTPNAVRLCYEEDEETLTASAFNVDPNSRFSLPSRGYEVTASDNVTELDGDTQKKRIANLVKLAEQKLIDKSSDIEYVEGKCQYVPEMQPNSAIEIKYERADLEWRGSVTNVGIKLAAPMQANFKARRFVRTGLVIEASGSAL